MTTIEINQKLPIAKAVFVQKEVDVINARDLWAFLESKQKFTHWITRRISRYKFVVGVDFITIKTPFDSENPQSVKDYYLTLDTAKGLSLLAKNHKGRMAWKYFIAYERAIRENPGQFKPERVIVSLKQQHFPRSFWDMAEFVRDLEYMIKKELIKENKGKDYTIKE